MDVESLNKLVSKALFTSLSVLGVVVVIYIVNIVWFNIV